MSEAPALDPIDAQAATNSRGAARARAALRQYTRALPAIRAAAADAARVRDAYADALGQALDQARAAEAAGRAAVALHHGSRVAAATSQLRAAQTKLNELQAEYQAAEQAVAYV